MDLEVGTKMYGNFKFLGRKYVPKTFILVTIFSDKRDSVLLKVSNNWNVSLYTLLGRIHELDFVLTCEILITDWADGFLFLEHTPLSVLGTVFVF